MRIITRYTIMLQIACMLANHIFDQKKFIPGGLFKSLSSDVAMAIYIVIYNAMQNKCTYVVNHS